MYISWLAILCMNLIGFTLILNAAINTLLNENLKNNITLFAPDCKVAPDVTLSLTHKGS